MNSFRYYYSSLSLPTSVTKASFSQKYKQILYGSVIVFLTVYVVFMLAFLGTAQPGLPTTISPDYSTFFPGFRCFHPISQDASRNQLLTFYGHRDLLNSPSVFRPNKRKLNPLDYEYTINSVPVCPPSSKTTLFIMILTQHEHYMERKAIRDTWGRIARDQPWPSRKLHGTVRLMFLLGTNVNNDLLNNVSEEADHHQDIIQADFQESYFNLTLKVLMGMKWIQTYCPNTQYVMKMDEDTFSDIPRILNILVSTSMTNTIYGPFSHAEEVVRDKSGKAAVSYESYPLQYYPPHVKGNLYVMPYNLAMNILNISEYFPYMNIEDAHITGILAKIFDARHINIPENLYDKHPRSDPDLCDFVSERKIAAQGIYPALVYNFWHRIEKSELCGIISVEKIMKDFSERKDIVEYRRVAQSLDSFIKPRNTLKSKAYHVSSSNSFGSRGFLTPKNPVTYRAFVTRNTPVNARAFVTRNTPVNARAFVTRNTPVNTREFDTANTKVRPRAFDTPNNPVGSRVNTSQNYQLTYKAFVTGSPVKSGAYGSVNAPVRSRAPVVSGTPVSKGSFKKPNVPVKTFSSSGKEVRSRRPIQ